MCKALVSAKEDPDQKPTLKDAVGLRNKGLGGGGGVGGGGGGGGGGIVGWGGGEGVVVGVRGGWTNCRKRSGNFSQALQPFKPYQRREPVF